MTALSFLLPIRTVSEANQREHHFAKAKRQADHRRVALPLTRAAMIRFGVSPASLIPATVTFTRYSAGTLDGDNLQGALKATRDAVADALGVNDGGPFVRWRYRQEKALRGTFGVRVDIWRSPKEKAC